MERLQVRFFKVFKKLAKFVPIHELEKVIEKPQGGIEPPPPPPIVIGLKNRWLKIKNELNFHAILDSCQQTFIQFWSVVNTLLSNSDQLSTHFYPILVSCQHTFIQFWSVVNTLLFNSGPLSTHFYSILVSCQHTFIQFWSVVNKLLFNSGQL